MRDLDQGLRPWQATSNKVAPLAVVGRSLSLCSGIRKNWGNSKDRLWWGPGGDNWPRSKIWAKIGLTEFGTGRRSVPLAKNEVTEQKLWCGAGRAGHGKLGTLASDSAASHGDGLRPIPRCMRPLPGKVWATPFCATFAARCWNTSSTLHRSRPDVAPPMYPTRNM